MKSGLTIHTVKNAVRAIFMAPDEGRYCLNKAPAAPLCGGFTSR